jgi:hypothetical protein
MREHWIRLRGGWEWFELSERPTRSRRLTLPVEQWPASLSGPIRLVRRFGCPPLDPARESLVLRLEDVSGLVALRFNDRQLEPPADGSDSLRLEPVLPRNELVLDVDPTRATGRHDSPTRWGQIALVVRPI